MITFMIHYPEAGTPEAKSMRRRIGDGMPAMLGRQFITVVVMVCCANPARGQVSPAQLRPILDLLQGKQYLSSQTDEYRDVLTELLSKSGS